MVAQHERRGADWLLLKGGFQRLLSEEQQSALLKALDAESFAQTTSRAR